MGCGNWSEIIKEKRIFEVYEFEKDNFIWTLMIGSLCGFIYSVKLVKEMLHQQPHSVVYAVHTSCTTLQALVKYNILVPRWLTYSNTDSEFIITPVSNLCLILHLQKFFFSCCSSFLGYRGLVQTIRMRYLRKHTVLIYFQAEVFAHTYRLLIDFQAEVFSLAHTILIYFQAKVFSPTHTVLIYFQAEVVAQTHTVF